MKPKTAAFIAGFMKKCSEHGLTYEQGTRLCKMADIKMKLKDGRMYESRLDPSTGKLEHRTSAGAEPSGAKPAWGDWVAGSTRESLSGYDPKLMKRTVARKAPAVATAAEASKEPAKPDETGSSPSAAPAPTGISAPYIYADSSNPDVLGIAERNLKDWYQQLLDSKAPENAGAWLGRRIAPVARAGRGIGGWLKSLFSSDEPVASAQKRVEAGPGRYMMR